ncbi:NnrU family protein [Tabrizicola oligotrophica]|uniref:NnrU family protein n=1 Tax=Tabrizicola oligotrophica TaxID=2710650 RepID=A0A6M0QVG6_9RHOB|nr:NnrU family protein [Tabrizicola oligotrophica]NEY91415.1 NnrU family protein [Tabrizicola oligotrophica]
MDWIELALAMGLFMASHRLPAALGLKGRIVGALGERGYTAVFSILSLALLWWLIAAAGRAPFVPLWDQQGWQRWAVNIAMPAAIVLGTFGIAAPNPFAFEGRASGFDPERPGIAGLTRQPLLWALALWSGAHLLANGDLAHVLLFAPFFLMALLGMKVIESRRRRALGDDSWQRLTARTGLLPGAALLSGRWRPGALPSLPRLGLALLIWVGLWHLHAPVIGLWPAP